MPVVRAFFYLCWVNTTTTFDIWTIVFLIASVQGYFVAFVMFRWQRGPTQANRLLALLLLLYALTMSEYVLYWSHNIYHYPHIAECSTQFPFLFGPILYWYCRSIYEGKKLQWKDALQVLPFAFAVSALIPWYMLDAADKQAVMRGAASSPTNGAWMLVVTWARILHLFAYAGYLFWYLRQQPKVAATTRWGTLLVLFFAGFALAYGSYYVLVRFPFFNSQWDYHISAMMTAFIYLIAYSGYVRPAVFEGFQWSEPSAARVKYRNSGLTPEAIRSLLAKLNALMEQERLYRDPDLSLDGLAEKLNAGKHHVSQVINECHGANFFEYVNKLRIEEAKRLLRESNRGELHIIEAAYSVGFNNKVSFNNAFKKATGMTPTAYRKFYGQEQSAACVDKSLG